MRLQPCVHHQAGQQHPSGIPARFAKRFSLCCEQGSRSDMVKRIGCLARLGFVSARRDLFGKLFGTIHKAGKLSCELPGKVFSVLQSIFKILRETFMRPNTGDGPGCNIQRVNVRRSFPEKARMGIPDKAGVNPILDKAVAAPYFQRAGRHGNIIPTGAEFYERRQNPVELLRILITALRLVKYGCNMHDHGKCLFRRHHEFQKLAP